METQIRSLFVISWQESQSVANCTCDTRLMSGV